ncbi:MAG TPA: dienelactone hydrolase family protein [Vicinamibacterales bacterium]|nr:dienelactone hydrolase family protein [Vicinamibacterales bacterium]
MGGKRIDLKSDDGVLDLHVFTPESGAGPWPAIVLYMDAFGIRPELASMAQRLASSGYVVALPNLYYRTPFAPFAPNVVATEGAERERFKGMIASINQAIVMRDTRLVLTWLDDQTSVKKGGVAALGYCMGGGYALSAAGTFPDRVVVAASFHGGSLATDKPDSPHRLAPQMRARVYIGAAEIDASFPPEQQVRLAHALTEAGVRHTIEIYPKAKHGFAMNGHIVYDRDAAELHWKRLVDLLKETLS